jgi:hypothetical protein
LSSLEAPGVGAYALAVGKNRMVSLGEFSTLVEWATPDPKALIEDPKPLAALTLRPLGSTQRWPDVALPVITPARSIYCIQVCS